MVFQQKIDALFATHTDISPELRTKIESFELSNNAILDALVEMKHISSDDAKVIKLQPYKAWPPAMQKLANGLFLKQNIANYKSAADVVQKTSDSMESIMSIPTLDVVFPWFLESQNKKLEDYLKFSDIFKMHYIDFGALSVEEKQALLTAVVDKHFVPLVNNPSSQFGLDPEVYTKFLRTVFDLQSQEVSVPTANGKPITLRFVKKDIDRTITCENGVLEPDKLPLQFTLDPTIDQYTKEFLQNYLHVDTSQEPIVLTADHLPGLLMAFAMQHTSQLSDEDKKKSLSDKAVAGKPEDVTLPADVADKVHKLGADPAKEVAPDDFSDQLDTENAMTGMEAWKDIAGGVKFENGVSMALQCCASNMHDELKGSGGYGLLTISNIVFDENGEPVSFSATLNGVEDTINGREDRVFHNLSFTSKTFDKFKELGQDSDIYVMPPQHDAGNFVDYINSGVHTGPEASRGIVISNLSACRANGTAIMREGKEIKYFGKELDSGGWVMFDVKFGADSVHIKDKG